MDTHKIIITRDGLIAGVKFMNAHVDGFDLGGDFYIEHSLPAICEILSAVFLASGIEVQTDSEHLKELWKNAREVAQDTYYL